jgi:hypothetical protein
MKWLLGVLMIIAVAAVWVATATAPPVPVSIDDVTLKFLPAQAQAIVFVDVAALRTAPLVIEVMNGKNPDYPDKIDDFIKATGFDPQRDLDKVTFAKLGANDSLIIAQGQVQKQKVEQYLKDRGSKTEAYLGQTIYRDSDGAFAVFDNVVLAGQFDAVKKAVDQKQLPGALPLRSDLACRDREHRAG